MLLTLTVRASDAAWTASSDLGSSFDELLWELAEKPDVTLLDDHMRARGYFRWLRSARPTSPEPEHDRGTPQEQKRKEIEGEKRIKAAQRERLDGRIETLRGLGASASPQALAELASALYLRNERKENTETAKVLKILEASVRSLDQRACLEFWERLDSSYFPVCWERGKLSNPGLCAVAAFVIQRLESMSGTVDGPESLRLAEALVRAASWRQQDEAVQRQIEGAKRPASSKRASAVDKPDANPYAQAPAIWPAEYKRAIKADVPGAVTAYAQQLARNARTVQSHELEEFLAAHAGKGSCFIEVKEALAGSYLEATKGQAALRSGARAAEILEELLQIPVWTHYGGASFSGSSRERGLSLLPEALRTRLNARAMAIAGPNGLNAQFLAVTEAAAEGDAAAMLQIADWYDPDLHVGECLSPAGRVINMDVGEAMAWRLRAACVGSAEAACAVGRMISDGRGATPSPRVALQWFQLAAMRGSADAMRTMLARLESGDPGWREAAQRWAGTLAQTGDPLAMLEYGRQLLAESRSPDTAAFAEAVAMLTRSAEAGMVGAMALLAETYADMPQSDPGARQAASWRQRAAEAGDVRSAIEFARSIAVDCSAPARSASGLQCIARALDQGSSEAEVPALSLLERIGDCVELRMQVLEVHRALARIGNWRSMVLLAGRYREGLVIPKDDAEAYYWLAIAATRAPDGERDEVARLREEVGEQLDPAARGAVQARCREYRPVAPAGGR